MNEKRKLLVALVILLAGLGGSWAPSVEARGAATPKRLTASLLAKAGLGTASPSDWADPPKLPLEKGPNGELVGTLRVAYAENFLSIDGNRQRLWLRSYNGGLTGPTIEVKAGDTLKINFKNDLPVQDPNCKDTDGEHGMDMGMNMADGVCAHPTKQVFNVTNLHTHGLHISPKGASDNVLRKICPGSGFTYQFDILPAGDPGRGTAKHYPGTFWYHAHNHGSTAMQLASGMSGALIVRGDVDELPEIKAARERIFVLQQLAYDENGQVEDFEKLKNEWKEGQRHTLVNGQAKPLIRMRPNQVERWRLVDSGIFEDLPIRIVNTLTSESFKMYRIAIDGITRPKPEEISEVELGPGYRVDLLVQAPAQSGTYYLYKGESKFSLLGKNTGPRVNDPQILAQIEVAGEPCTSSVPGCATQIPKSLLAPTYMLPDIPQPGETVVQRPTIKFGVEDAEQSLFTINGTCFDSKKPVAEPVLGTVEEWSVKNNTEQVHPFHIHVNAFQMLDAQGKPAEWRDTILVPPGKTVKFRTRFERFDGDFVLHCHILTHEDSGMMALVRVKPKTP